MCARLEKVRKTAAFTLFKCKKQFKRVYGCRLMMARVFFGGGAALRCRS